MDNPKVFQLEDVSSRSTPWFEFVYVTFALALTNPHTDSSLSDQKCVEERAKKPTSYLAIVKGVPNGNGRRTHHHIEHLRQAVG